MKSTLAICFFNFVFLLSLFAQPAALPAFLKDSLDAYVERALKDWDIPGVAVGVVKDGQLIVAKGYGVRELGKPEKVDANTLFMIGSNTKAFTGTALALLEHEGKCHIEDPAGKWLPAFSMKDGWVENHVTLADLVSHRMGMETFQGDFMYWTSDLTQEQVMEKFGKMTPVYGFRSQWGYTNAGFLAAGMCIEKISGRRWEDYLRERIFQPLGMTRTLALSTEILVATNAARAHSLDGWKPVLIPYGNIDNLAPAGSISSSINDMSRWVIAHLENGKLGGKEVLPSAAINRTREPLSIEGRRRTTSTGIRRHYALYGMGWELSDYECRELVSHTGGVNGFVTAVTLVPEERLGIIVLTNTDANGFYSALNREILDACLGLSYKNYSKLFLQDAMANKKQEEELLKQMKDTIASHPKTAVSLDAYCGRYQNDAYGWLEMQKDGSNLKVIFQNHSKLIGKLEPLGGNRFLLSFNDILFGVKPVRFTVSEEKVKTFTLQVADFVEFTPYEFVKM